MRVRYLIGQHGAKRREQRRLSEAYSVKVCGRTHESEHTIGFDPLKQTSGLKRGKSSKARRLEKQGWAYQEQKKFHRAHIGTGSIGKPDDSAFTSDSYRASQRSLLEKRNVNAAVQLNQLCYAFLPNFQVNPNTRERAAASDSFREMVTNMDKVTYASGTETACVEVAVEDKLEMYLSRLVAEGKGEGNGGWPSVEQVKSVKNKLGLC